MSTVHGVSRDNDPGPYLAKCNSLGKFADGEKWQNV